MSAANTDMSFQIQIKQGMPPLTLKRPSFETETDIVNHVRQRAFAAAETIPDSSTRQNTLAGVAGQIACGQYDWEWDPSTGLTNWVDLYLKSFNGQKQFMFFALKNSTDNNILRTSAQAWELFVDNIWDKIAKREEVFSKLGMFNKPNPPEPPQTNPETTGDQMVQAPDSALSK